MAWRFAFNFRVLISIFDGFCLSSDGFCLVLCGFL